MDRKEHPAYARPMRKMPNYVPPEHREPPDIEDTAADDTSLQDLPRFFDEQVEPQPVYLINEQPGPFVVHTTFSSYNVDNDTTKVIGNRYSVERTITITNTGASDVFVSSNPNGQLSATSYRLVSGVQDYVKSNTTEPVYVYTASGNESEVSVMEEWRDDT